MKLGIVKVTLSVPLSLSSRRAWIEIEALAAKSLTACLSLSSRRAWIEIVYLKIFIIYLLDCRSPHGERGLKSHIRLHILKKTARRSPHGERGLK